MKKITLFIVTVAAAVLFAACGTPVENKPANTANTNANAAKAPAPPTKEALMAIEKGAFEAWKNKDGKFFETNLDDKFIMPVSPGKNVGKGEAVKMITENKCTVASYSFSDERMSPAGADAAVLTTKVTQDVTCEGKKEPAEVVVASVYARRGDTWKIAAHNEIPVKADDKAAKPAAPAEKKADAPAPATKKSDTVANEKVTAPADKKDPGLAKKEQEEMDADANSDPLMALQKEAWEAWKARDAKRMSDWTTSDLVFVDPAGQVHTNKDDVIKTWTEPKCDIKSVTVSDGTSVAVTADASVLISKGTAAGTCEGQKVPPLWGMSVYVKQDTSWKVAYLMEWEG